MPCHTCIELSPAGYSDPLKCTFLVSLFLAFSCPANKGLILPHNSSALECGTTHLQRFSFFAAPKRREVRNGRQSLRSKQLPVGRTALKKSTRNHARESSSRIYHTELGEMVLTRRSTTSSLTGQPRTRHPNRERFAISGGTEHHPQWSATNVTKDRTRHGGYRSSGNSEIGVRSDESKRHTCWITMELSFIVMSMSVTLHNERLIPLLWHPKRIRRTLHVIPLRVVHRPSRS